MKTALDIARGIALLPVIVIRVLIALPFMVAYIGATMRNDTEAQQRIGKIIDRILGTKHL